MGRWKRDAKDFVVSINFHPTRGSQATIPRPLMERFDNPPRLRFRVRGSHVEVEGLSDPTPSGDHKNKKDSTKETTK